MNHGLIIEPILPEDFILGSDRSLETKFGAEVLEPTGNWKNSLPKGENQAPGYETSSCVAHGTNKALQVLAKRLYNDESNLSDRKVAKGSGTDPAKGNTPKKVADYLYRNWSCLEADWPTTAARTVEEFYADLPQYLKALAHSLGAQYEFGYEYVGTSKSTLKTALKYSPVCISVPAWYRDQDGKYYRPDKTPDGHWTLLYGFNEAGEYLIHDSYEPYFKVMRADFNPTIAMRYHLKKRPETPFPFKKFILLIRKLLGL